MANSGLTEDRWSDLQLPSFAIGLDEPQHRGSGVIVKAFSKQITQFKSKDVPRLYEPIHISSRCHTRTSPYMPGLSEEELGMNQIGTN